MASKSEDSSSLTSDPSENDLPRRNDEFHVAGQITGLSKSVLAGATVRVYDQDLRKRQKLAERHLDSEGRYSATYHRDQFSRAEQDSADLVVVVFDAEDAVIATSPIRFSAKSSETIDLVISKHAPQLKSEYEVVLDAVI